MVSYYASSSEPPQIRGKTIYIRYSNRHEIVNNQIPGDVPGNVLLVTFEGVKSHEVSIDVIRLVFRESILRIDRRCCFSTEGQKAKTAGGVGDTDL